LAPVKRKKLSEAVIDEIRQMIEDGELKIGQKAPSHSEFAKILRVSRTTLREALHTLDMMGVVEQRSGYGTVILAPLPADYKTAFKLPAMGGPEAVRELLDAREVVEMGALPLAISGATEGDMAAIGRCFGEMETALTQARFDDYTRKDLEFHFLIVRAARNRFLLQAFENLRGYTEKFMAEGFRIAPRMREKSLEQHRRIHEALAQRESLVACEEMGEHIRHRRAIFKPLLRPEKG